VDRVGGSVTSPAELVAGKKYVVDLGNNGQPIEAEYIRIHHGTYVLYQFKAVTKAGDSVAVVEVRYPAELIVKRVRELNERRE